jgi:hypothetical protein
MNQLAGKQVAKAWNIRLINKQVGEAHTLESFSSKISPTISSTTSSNVTT